MKYYFLLNRYFIFVLLFYCAASSLAQAPSGKLRFNQVFPPSGKTFMHITAMAQDKRGYIWLATKKGLFRYNGYEMMNYSYDPLDPNSIPSNELESLSVDSAGNIWIASLGAGIFRFDPIRQTFTRFRHSAINSNSLSADWVSVVFCDSKGNIWAGSGLGLDLFDPKTQAFTHYRYNAGDPGSISSNEVVGIYEDRKGILWVGTGSIYGPNKDNPSVGGLNRMDDINGRFTRFLSNPSDSNSLVTNKVRSIYEGRDGTFWVGTSGDGLHILDRGTGKFTRLGFQPGNPSGLSRPPVLPSENAMISFITEDVKGGLWIGTTDNGITYYDPTSKNASFVLLSGPDEMAMGASNTWTAFSSSEGLLWITSIGGGLFTYNPLQVKVPFVPARDEVIGFYEAGDASLWVASLAGLLHFDKELNLKDHFESGQGGPVTLGTGLLFTMQPYRNELWIGTFGFGIVRFNPRTGQSFGFAQGINDDGLDRDTVVRILLDGEEKIWAGTTHGLRLLDTSGRTLRKYIFYPQDTAMMGKNLISCLLVDRSKRFWVGSFFSGGLQLLDRKTGISKAYLAGISISALLQDNEGTLWAAATEGLFRYDNRLDSFFRFNDPAGLLPIADIRTMIQDDEENLWLTTGNSLIKINAKRDIITAYDGHVGVTDNLMYGQSYKARSGELYFPAEGGFYHLNPRKFNQDAKPPRIILSNFRISNQLILPGPGSVLKQDISVANEMVLKYDQNIFSFDFAGVDLIDASANRHLFRLDGYDRSWNVAAYDRKASYFNVPPGSYVFRVRAVNAYGKWAERAVRIEIVPAWWGTWWFRSLALILVTAGIYFILRWRVKEKYRLQMERAEKEKEVSRLQHRTSQLEMHALRAQMNPHFLFNSLNSINRFIIQNNSDEASEYLTKFSRLMRLILQNSQHELITLDNELEALRLYLELEAVRFDHHFTYSVSVEEHLDPGVVRVPPLIIQPYAENAIWHGLMHKEEKGNLSIALIQEEGYLVCSIIDDGIGRQKAAELKSKSASVHKSMGMKITADRIASMTHGSSSGNNIIISDLLAANGSPAGTKVEIKIALKYDQGRTH